MAASLQLAVLCVQLMCFISLNNFINRKLEVLGKHKPPPMPPVLPPGVANKTDLIVQFLDPKPVP